MESLISPHSIWQFAIRESYYILFVAFLFTAKLRLLFTEASLDEFIQIS